MSYDTPQREQYGLPSAAYGATTASVAIIGPAGKTGYVRDIEFRPSADCVGTATVPEITVGTAAGTTEYGRMRLGTTAVAGYTVAQGPRRAKTLVLAAGGNGAPPPVLNDYPGHVALETSRIPADTPVVVTGKAGTGGTPAGTFSAVVIVDWF